MKSARSTSIDTQKAPNFHDHSHGWLNGPTHSKTTFRLGPSAGRESCQTCLPTRTWAASRSRCDELILRRHTRRQYSRNTPNQILQNLPGLETLEYEPWFEKAPWSILSDASDFQAYWPRWTWNDLEYLARTSRFLDPEESQLRVNEMVQLAGVSVMNMPKLDVLEIWNGWRVPLRHDRRRCCPILARDLGSGLVSGCDRCLGKDKPENHQ